MTQRQNADDALAAVLAFRKFRQGRRGFLAIPRDRDEDATRYLTTVSQMKEKASCSDCGSTELISGVPILAFTSAGGGGLGVQIAANPHAMIFKEIHNGMISATVCGSCGLVKLYANNPAELLQAYHQSQKS